MALRMTGKKCLVILAILGILGGVAWWQGEPLLARYYVHELRAADESNCADWLARVVALDEAALPALLGALESAENKETNNVEAALVALVNKWGPEDPRAHLLLERAAGLLGTVNVRGQAALLHIPQALLTKSHDKLQLPPAVTRLAGTMLATAAKSDPLRTPALHLACALVEQVPHGQWLPLCRDLAIAGLNSANAETRVGAVQLVLRPTFRQEKDMLERVVPLLKDSNARVRQAALVALGPATDIVKDDDLLPMLHDPDDGVHNLCELALRRRGLEENHILLARLISDERPSARLEVVQYLREATDLEPGVWLRRLCQDPVPAVRAAAVRAAVAQTQVDLRGCLEEMAQKDPSPTVRQLAGHYLTRARVIAGD
jgi:HEAT repeat protein